MTKQGRAAVHRTDDASISLRLSFWRNGLEPAESNPVAKWKRHLAALATHLDPPQGRSTWFTATATATVTAVATTATSSAAASSALEQREVLAVDHHCHWTIQLCFPIGRRQERARAKRPSPTSSRSRVVCAFPRSTAVAGRGAASGATVASCLASSSVICIWGGRPGLFRLFALCGRRTRINKSMGTNTPRHRLQESRIRRDQGDATRSSSGSQQRNCP